MVLLLLVDVLVSTEDSSNRLELVFVKKVSNPRTMATLMLIPRRIVKEKSNKYVQQVSMSLLLVVVPQMLLKYVPLNVELVAAHLFKVLVSVSAIN
jgi:hypothetical protein